MRPESVDVTLHIEEDDITDFSNKKNDHPEIKTNSSSSHSVTADKSKVSLGSLTKAKVSPGSLARKSPLLRQFSSTPVFSGLEKSGEKVSI